MKFRLEAILLLGLLSSCAVAPSWTKTLSPEEKESFKQGRATVQKLVECGDRAAGNDAKFTAECAEIFSKEKTLVRVDGVGVNFGNGYELKGALADDTKISCSLSGSAASTKEISKINTGSLVMVSGRVRSLLKISKVAPGAIPYGDRYSYRINLDPCRVLQ